MFASAAVLFAAVGAAIAAIPVEAQPIAVNATCLDNPANASCANYTLPENVMANNVMMLCMMMPWMPVCELRRQCATPEVSGLSPPSELCTNTSLLAAGCRDMPLMAGCQANWVRMCAPGSVVEACNVPTLTIPRTMMINGAMASICNAEPALPACATFNASCAGLNGTAMGSCNALGTYASLCSEASWFTPACADYTNMCQNNISSWPLCQGFAPAPACALNEPCINNPNGIGCANYKMPEMRAQMDAGMLCMMMPWMGVCTLRNQCALPQVQAMNSSVCTGFALLDSGCTDMPLMAACSCNYHRMCPSSGSPVLECDSVPDVPYPRTLNFPGVIAALCAGNDTAPACANVSVTCPAGSAGPGANLTNCDFLQSYADICAYDPTPVACADYRAMCGNSTVSTFPICDGYAPPTTPPSSPAPSSSTPSSPAPSAAASAATGILALQQAGLALAFALALALFQ